MEIFTSVEFCAGAGGTALGLEQAGFKHEALLEIDEDCCETLKLNRSEWNIENGRIEDFIPSKYRGVDLISAGLPCPPFSIAGKQLGGEDERNLFPPALEIIKKIKPKAVMIENVRGILDPKFIDFRLEFAQEVEKLGFLGQWQLLNACDYGIPQLRPRAIYVALKRNLATYFRWPIPMRVKLRTVGQVLFHEMSSNGWKGAKTWAEKANEIAPTLVGGSKKHGGPDLGPTRAKAQWKKLGVNGHSIAEEPPDANFQGLPRLTVKMAAILQGFEEWHFYGKKTSAYRQVGNAFPPPVSKAVALQIKKALLKEY